MRKNIVIAGIATAVGVTGLTGFTVANAATERNGSADHRTSLIQAVATKFNLKEADVQSVFNAQHEKMEAEREAEVKAKIAQLVSDGKITQAQADKIIAKRAELKAEHEAERAANPDMTREEMRAERSAHRTELEAWAKENGIDSDYLREVFSGPRGHGGPGGGAGPRHE